jgi:hypothetical protein
MCYDLYNPSIAVCRKVSRQFWAKALELARLYGWQPAGTRPMPGIDLSKLGAEWHGTYLTNDGQVVESGDALALAAALERSLEDISESRVEADWDFEAWRRYELPEWLSPDERELVEEGLQEGLLDISGTDALEFFAGEERYHLGQLVRFCRLGSFEIL